MNFEFHRNNNQRENANVDNRQYDNRNVRSKTVKVIITEFAVCKKINQIKHCEKRSNRQKDFFCEIKRKFSFLKFLQRKIFKFFLRDEDVAKIFSITRDKNQNYKTEKDN